MKQLFIILATVLALASCTPVPETNNGEDIRGVKDNTVSAIKNGIRYFRDERTGLCFAAVVSRTYSGYYNHNITCVPCDSLKQKIVVLNLY